jgi:hypothetical protein
MVDFAALEPLSTGDIIDRAVRIYRRNFTALVCIVAIPTLINYAASVLFWYGYSQMIMSMQPGPDSAPGSLPAPGAGPIVGLLIGALLYPVWLFALLTSVAGIARMVGDYMMLGETITVRRFFKAVWKRLGDIVLMALLSIVILFAVSMVVYIALILMMLLIVVMLAAVSTLGPGSGLPPWAGGLIVVVISIAAVIGFFILVLVIISRVIFMPQVVMIEGQSAGSALGRAFQLGSRNWKRLAAVVLFTYFVQYSIQFALLIPLGVGFYLSGSFNPEFFVNPTWTILYSAFGEIATLLSLPIWITALTLLYFDNRVRKEGYDVELLARSVHVETPLFEPALAGMQPAAFGYRVPASPTGRVFVQTSPLGLAGYSAPTARPEPVIAVAPPEPAPESSVAPEATSGPSVDDAFRPCPRCRSPLPPGGRFCHVCGLAIPIRVI